MLLMFYKFSATLNMSLQGGKHPAQSTSEDDEKNFRNIPFQQDTQLQQVCWFY